MIELKTPREIEEMKPAGRFVGGILKELQETTKVGTNLLEIDEFVHKKIVDRKGAESCYVDYAPDFGTGPFATTSAPPSTTPCCTACRTTTA